MPALSNERFNNSVCDHPQAYPANMWRDKLEAVTHLSAAIKGGSLIPIVVCRDGDGWLLLNTYTLLEFVALQISACDGINTQL
jgi:hypothetical protein